MRQCAGIELISIELMHGFNSFVKLQVLCQDSRLLNQLAMMLRKLCQQWRSRMMVQPIWTYSFKLIVLATSHSTPTTLFIEPLKFLRVHDKSS